MPIKNTIIIPTYNEQGNIKRIIPALFGAIPEAYVLVVDDNSPDGTATQVQSLMSTYPRLSLFLRKKKEGLGRAYVDAFTKILADPSVGFITTMDADFSHDPNVIPSMLARLRQGCGVVVGSRYVPGGGIVGWERWRVLLSRYGNLYAKLITRMPVYDLTGGFNSYSTDVLRNIKFDDIDASGYAFQIEMKHAIWKMGAKITEIPIIFKNRIAGESKISKHIIREGLLTPWKLRFGTKK